MPSTLTAWIAESKQRIPPELSERFNRGNWIAAYRIVGDLPQMTVHQLDQTLRELERTVNPIPEFLNDRVLNRQTEETRDPPSVTFKVCEKICVFWCASPDGYFFVASTYGEDNHTNTNTKTLHTMLPAWRTAECLAHAATLASLTGCEVRLIQMQIEWCGLIGRNLGVVNRFEPTANAERADVISAMAETTAAEIQSNAAKLVQVLTAGFYHNFGATYPINWLSENPNIRG